MAAPHFHHHPGHVHGGPRHVCMMEGSDPEIPQSTARFQTVVDENRRYVDELAQLKALLVENNIAIPVPESAIARRRRRSLRFCNKNGVLGLNKESADNLPQLPTEILLRILEYAITSPTPIVDPFYRLRKHNVTEKEKKASKDININFLAVNKAFNTDGTRLLVEKNEFVFTQAAALDCFAKVPKALRKQIQNVTIRCVGRYYHDKAKELDLRGDTIYHESLPGFTVPALVRPPGLIQDSGLQAYCWYQLGDMLKTLALPLNRAKLRPKLFPALRFLRLDLVNFCDHLPLRIWAFASILRWHLGGICDELLITGIPGLEGGSDEEMVLRNLLRDEGVISTGCPVFISSTKGGLLALEGHGYSQQVVRANPEINKQIRLPKKVVRHPEGGTPPTSSYPAHSTIWKWTSDHTNRPKTWIEFDRITGLPMDELHLRMDTDDSDDDDEDDEDDDEGEDWDDEDGYDSSDMFPPISALAALLNSSMGFPIGISPVDFHMNGFMASGGPSSDHDMESDGDMPDLIPIDDAYAANPSAGANDLN